MAGAESAAIRAGGLVGGTTWIAGGDAGVGVDTGPTAPIGMGVGHKAK